MYRNCCFFILVLLGYLLPLSAVTTVVTRTHPQDYNQVYYENFYNTAPSNYGYYNGGYPNYGYYDYWNSPPPPSPADAFPDDARQDALYRQIQDE